MWTMLVADDERTIREGIARSVDCEALGISRILLASDGREAYDIILREQPDIAILDIVMPEMTGIEVISQITNRVGGPQFIILSGHGEFDYAQEAIRNNVNSYLLKPCGSDEINGTVQKVINKLNQKNLMERERRQLREDVILLKPQAQEQVLRNVFLEKTQESLELFEKVFCPDYDAYKLLLIALEEPADYPRLMSLSCILEAPMLYCKTLLHDGAVLVFGAKIGTELVNVAEGIINGAAKEGIFGLRAAISGPGALSKLPDLCQKAWEAVHFFAQPYSGTASLVDAEAPPYSKSVRHVMAYVHDNLCNPDTSIYHIASNVLYLNPDYLGKLFKKECGIKFSDYLMKLRIEKARELLMLSPDIKMYEIAEQIGLRDNAAYFGQAFKKYTGMLPSEFRTNHARKGQSSY